MVVINEGFLLNCFVSWLAHHVREKICFSNLETRQKETESDFRVNSKTLDLRSSRPPVNAQGQSCFEVSLFDLLQNKIGEKTKTHIELVTFILLLPKEFRNFQFHLAEIELSGQLRIKPFYRYLRLNLRN